MAALADPQCWLLDRRKNRNDEAEFMYKYSNGVSESIRRGDNTVGCRVPLRLDVDPSLSPFNSSLCNLVCRNII